MPSISAPVEPSERARREVRMEVTPLLIPGEQRTACFLFCPSIGGGQKKSVMKEGNSHNSCVC